MGEILSDNPAYKRKRHRKKCPLHGLNMAILKEDVDLSSSLSREHPLLATIVMGEFSFEITRGEKMLCASDMLHGVFTDGKDWNELLNMIVEAIYCHKGDEYKVQFNYIPEPGEEDAVVAAIERDAKHA